MDNENTKQQPSGPIVTGIPDNDPTDQTRIVSERGRQMTRSSSGQRGASNQPETAFEHVEEPFIPQVELTEDELVGVFGGKPEWSAKRSKSVTCRWFKLSKLTSGLSFEPTPPDDAAATDGEFQQCFGRFGQFRRQFAAAVVVKAVPRRPFPA